ncbi:NUDIX domain-containing protein [Salinifilum ghardaiensis]
MGRTNGAHDFTVAGSEDIYVGTILALRADEVDMPGGRRARREVVEHYGAVAVLALDEDERVTLIHQYRYPLGRRLWELPAGLLDVDAESSVEAARRELAEEVGLDADEWSVLVDVASSPGFTDESVRVFLARQLRAVDLPPAAADEEADLTVTSVPLDEAVAMVFDGEIVNAPAVSGLLAARAVRDGVHRPRPADASWQDRPRRFAQRGGAAGHERAE